MHGFELTGETGSFVTHRGGTTYGNRFRNGVEILVSGSLYRADGQDLYFREFDLPEQNNGVASGIDGEENERLFAKVTYRDLTLETARVSREKDVPTSYYGTVFPDPAAWRRDFSYFAQARFDGDLRGTSVGACVSLDEYRYDSDVTMENPLYNPIPPYRFLVGDFGMHRTVGTEVKLTRVVQHHTGTVGGEYRNSFRLRGETFLKDPHVSVISVNHPSKIWALFLQDEIRIAPGWIVNAGFRHDHYSTFSGTTSPRAALIWSPVGTTTLKVLYGQAFRAPNAYELYWSNGGTSHKANPRLRPERIKTREAVLEQRFGSNLSAVATGYFYNMEHLIAITTDPADGLVWYTNQGKVRAWGAELEALAKWLGGWEGRASCSLQRAWDQETRARLPNSPRFMGKASAAIPLPIRRMSLGLEGQYFGPREPIRPSHMTRANGYALFNATMTGRNIIGGTSLSASVYNVFDRQYGDLGAPDFVQELLPQDGRSYRLKLTFRL
jgi:iron complex outermembrane receptor protein